MRFGPAATSPSPAGQRVRESSMTGMTQARTVLVHSDRPEIRDQLRRAVGFQPAPDLRVEFLDAATYRDCRSLIETHYVDLLLLDGEARPVGGMGIARQLHDELDDPPLICLVIARAADRWLAAYAQADATLVHPIDPVTAGQTTVTLLTSS